MIHIKKDKFFPNVLLIIIFLSVFQTVYASWEALPPQIIIDESHVVVMASVNYIKPGTIGKKNYDIANLKILKILKGNISKDSSIKVVMRDLSKLPSSSDILFRKGQKGYFMLQKYEDDFYHVLHPDSFQPMSKQKFIENLIEKRLSVHAGKVTQGLIAMLEIDSTKQIQHSQGISTNQHLLRFSLKNNSQEQLTISYSIYEHPLKLSWQGPDGKEIKSNLYELLRPPKKQILPTNIKMRPQEIRYFGPLSRFQPILILSNYKYNVTKGINVALPGKHRIVAIFRFNLIDDSGKSKTREITSNEILLDVKP